MWKNEEWDRERERKRWQFYLQTILQHCACFSFSCNKQHNIAKCKSLKLLVKHFDKKSSLIIMFRSGFFFMQKHELLPQECSRFQWEIITMFLYSLLFLKKKMSSFSFQKAELKRCDKNVAIIKSANQLIYEYYHDVSTAELKAYALIQLAYMFYTVYNRGKFMGLALIQLHLAQIRCPLAALQVVFDSKPKLYEQNIQSIHGRRRTLYELI